MSIANYSPMNKTGDGTTKTYTIEFDYLRRAFVYTKVNGTATTAFEINSSKQLTFNTAPANGAEILIYRDTPTTPLVSWADASVLKAKDMTIQQVQELHILEEQQHVTDGMVERCNNALDACEDYVDDCLAYSTTAQNAASVAETKAGLATTQAGIATQKASDISASAAQIETNRANIALLKNYVTPEMYGAVGDGVADDTNAIQQAINYGKEHSLPIIANKTYYITTSLILAGADINQNVGNIDFTFNKIVYNGNDVALLVSKHLVNVRGHLLKAITGSGVRVGGDSYNYEILIDINTIIAINGYCCINGGGTAGVTEVTMVGNRWEYGINGLLLDTTYKWVGQNSVYNVHFTCAKEAGQGGYAIKADCANNSVTGYNFYNVSFEGSQGAFEILNTTGLTKTFETLNVFGARVVEMSLTDNYNLLKITGTGVIQGDIHFDKANLSAFDLSNFSGANGDRLKFYGTFVDNVVKNGTTFTYVYVNGYLAQNKVAPFSNINTQYSLLGSITSKTTLTFTSPLHKNCKGVLFVAAASNQKTTMFIPYIFFKGGAYAITMRRYQSDSLAFSIAGDISENSFAPSIYTPVGHTSTSLSIYEVY